MEHREMFMKLSLAEMSEMLARKLTQERTAAHDTATKKLEKLEAEMGDLKYERRNLVAAVAYEKIRSLTPDETRECDIYSHTLSGPEADTLVLHVPFEVPDAVKELDARISAINKEMAEVRDEAALQVSRDATQAKELDLAYLVTRMSRQNKPVTRAATCSGSIVVDSCCSGSVPVAHYPAFSGVSYGYGVSGASEEGLKGEFPI